MSSSAMQPIAFHDPATPKRSKGVSLFTVLLLAPICIALAAPPKVFGVVPPPGGGYPGNNTAEGASALFSLTTGGRDRKSTRLNSSHVSLSRMPARDRKSVV